MIATSFLSMMMFPILVLSGGQADLLDMINTDLYWETAGQKPTTANLIALLKPQEVTDAGELIAQLGSDDFDVREQATQSLINLGPGVLPQVRKALDSEDAEVRMRAQRVIDALSGKSGDRPVRRLMAIRTLGEQQARDALPVLKGIAAGDELFEAEYAKRAIAQIEGDEYAFEPVAQKVLDGDLWSMPKDTGHVIQARMLPGAAIDLDALIKQQVDMMKAVGMGGMDAAAVKRQMHEGLMKAVEQIGNVRIDAATVAVAHDIGPRSGWVIFRVRGVCDPKLIMAMLKRESRRDAETIGGIEVVRPEGDVRLGFLSPTEMLFVAAPEDDISEKRMAELIKVATGKARGGLADNKTMVKLLEDVDRTKQAWAVGRINDEVRSLHKLFEPLDSYSAETALKDGSLKYVVKVHGKDADKVKVSAATFMGLVTTAKLMLTAQTEQMPFVTRYIEVLNGLKMESSNGTATLSGEVKDVAGTLGMGPMILFGICGRRGSAGGGNEARAVEEAAEPVEVIEE